MYGYETKLRGGAEIFEIQNCFKNNGQCGS
jgi:hypothetical protein